MHKWKQQLYKELQRSKQNTIKRKYHIDFYIYKHAILFAVGANFR